VKGRGLDANRNYTIWIQNYTVTEGAILDITKDESGAQENVTTAANGSFGYGVVPNSNPVAIWNISSTATVTNHEHDIVVYNLESGIVGTYRVAYDGLDSASVAGIIAPVTEVSTVLLFSSGLLALVGYCLLRSRRN
jgi:hypothetical protein